MKKLFYFLLFLFLVSCSFTGKGNDKENNTSLNSFLETQETATRIEGKVVRVKDGDTFVVLLEGKEQTVRFTHIDCPEKGQPFGNKAKQFVSDLCAGANVTLVYEEHDKYDVYERLLAEVLLEDGRNLNKELVKNGLAWHFKKYSDREEYANLEMEARKNKKGIWSSSNPIPPWFWRQGK